jgi:ABC-2 type transport system permease protein
MSFQRISAIIVQHLLRLRHSLEEVVDTFYWPLMDVIIWGFMTSYLSRIGGTAGAVIGFLLGGLILWIVVWRSQQDVTISFLWDIWHRNLLNLLTTPLSRWEFVLGVVILGGIKIIATLMVASAVAYLFYSFNLFSLGFILLPFFANLLLFGWIMGILITGLILRFGRGIQNLAWSFLVLLNPVSAVYYPVASLPPLLQLVAQVIPISYVFEGMRLVLANKILPSDYLIKSTGLNLLYLVLVIWIFNLLFEQSRASGRLVKLGK